MRIYVRNESTVFARRDEISDQRTGVFVERGHVGLQYFEMESVRQKFPAGMPFSVWKKNQQRDFDQPERMLSGPDIVFVHAVESR